MPHEGPAGAGEPHKPKGRGLNILSAFMAAAAITALFVGGSQPSHSTLGITLIIVGLLALTASVFLFVTAHSMK
jgi:hypothetical protein